jgi:MFS transporter, DHA1 family, inner membrane transport protein
MMVLCSVSTVAGSLSTFFSLFLLSRFLVGFGIGAVFPPIVVLLIRYFKKGSEGAAIGWNSLAYNFGGILGLSGWAILGLIVGWRLSLLVGGVFAALFALLFWKLLPKFEEGLQNFKLSFNDLKLAFLNKKLTLITIALFGIGASSSLNSNFIVYFLETSLKASPVDAGLIGGAGPLLAITSPFVGKYYDRTRTTGLWLLAAALLVTFGVSVTALNSLLSALLSSVLVGLGASTGYTIALTKAREIGISMRAEYQSIAVAWTDSLSLFGGFVAPIIFSFFVVHDGYSDAWLFGSLFAIILVLPLLLSRK